MLIGFHPEAATLLFTRHINPLASQATSHYPFLTLQNILVHVQWLRGLEFAINWKTALAWTGHLCRSPISTAATSKIVNISGMASGKASTIQDIFNGAPAASGAFRTAYIAS